MSEQHRVSLEEGDEGGVFYLLDEDRRRMARLTYSLAGATRITLDYVEVDRPFRGRGFARKLVDEIARFAREREVQIIPICGVAGGILRSDSKYSDVLAT